jgi:hypothetical protein
VLRSALRNIQVRWHRHSLRRMIASVAGINGRIFQSFFD